MVGVTQIYGAKMNATPKPKQQLLTVPDVAELCSIAPETVRRLTDRGTLPRPVRLGRAVRYRLDEIEQWIQDNCPDLSKRGQK